MLPEWDKEHISIIATIGAYNPENPAGCEIENCTAMRLYDKSDIGNTCLDNPEEKTRWFSISGMELDGNNLPQGIVIKKRGSKVEKMVVK